MWMDSPMATAAIDLSSYMDFLYNFPIITAVILIIAETLPIFVQIGNHNVEYEDAFCFLMDIYILER